MTTKLGQDNLDDPIVRHIRPTGATLRVEQTVGEALAYLRERELADSIVYFYVVDAAKTLVGVVPTRRLLMSSLDTPIASIMDERVAALPSTATVFDACEFFVLYRFLAIPVVDDQRRLLGVVDINLFTDEIINAGERQAVDDVFQLMGINVAMAASQTAWYGFQNRFPWLLCNIAGGIVCALLAGMFQHLLELMVVLALFIPVVLALAESVSMQSMTLTLQALHQRKISAALLWRMVRVGVETAVLLGLACGALVGGVAWLWKGDAVVAGVIAATIFLSIITASLLGVALPSALHVSRLDPKVAAGPIVLATADIITLLLYFALAGWGATAILG